MVYDFFRASRQVDWARKNLQLTDLTVIKSLISFRKAVVYIHYGA